MTDIEEIIQTFVSHLTAHYRLEQIESFWQLEPNFRQLVSDGFAAKAMNQQIRDVVNNPTHLGDWRSNQVILHRAPAIALALASFEATRQHIHLLPFFAMYSPAGDTPLRFNRFRLPNHFRNAVFDPSIKLIPDGSGVVEPGDVLTLHSQEFVYDFLITKPQLIVKLTTSAYQTQEWLFNRDTLAAWQAVDSELAATQLRVAAYTVSRLANTDSIDVLMSITHHSHHTVRWAAIQALGRLSRSKAMEALEVASKDEHPHIAKAASKTLATLKSTEREGSSRGN